MKGLFVLLFFFSVLATGCSKRAPYVVVVNATGDDLMEVQVHAVGDTQWMDDKLTEEYLQKGGSSKLLMPDGFQSGVYALRGVNADGREITWPTGTLTNRQIVILRMPDSGYDPLTD